MNAKKLLLTTATLSLGLVATTITPQVTNTTVYASESGWQGKNFIKADGTQAKSEWIQDNGSWFYIKDNGEYASDEWVGNYYFKYWGYMAQNEWIELNGKWYYLKADGQYAWQEWIGNYYFNYWGDMAHDTWVETYGNWYYLNHSGTVNKGWLNLANTWYYMNQNGVMQTGWQDISGNWYYMNGSGAMATNQWVDNYYMGSNGIMLKNTTTPDGYYVNASGQWANKPSSENVVYNNNYDTSLYGWNLTPEQVAYTDTEAQKVASEIITSDMTDFDKAREITKWVFANTIKDHRQSAEIYKKTHGDTAWAVFKNHRAACSGYVRAFKLLGKYAGLQVEIVNEDEWTHQWNTVYLADEGRWIDCDSQAPHYDHQRFIPKDFGFTVYKRDMFKLVETDNPDRFVVEYMVTDYYGKPSSVYYNDNCDYTYEEILEAYQLTGKWTKWYGLHLFGDEISFDESTVQ